KRIGAVVIFERTEPVSDLVTRGIPMECEPQPEILNSIFYKQSPLHDGAILISSGKIIKVSCYLPLSTREDLPQEWGTRHRAALGLSEQCSAWILVISEERGEVSFAFDNQVRKIKDKKELSFLLENEVFNEKEPEIKMRRVILSLFTKRYRIKAAVFSLVFILWLAFAGQQNFEKRIDLPLDYRNVPEGLVVTSPSVTGISVTCKGLRKDISLLTKDNMISSLDLSSAKKGKSFHNITEANLTLPNDRIDIVNISPRRIEIVVEKVSKPEIKDKPSSAS
ncbi:MAG: diadenylate cyclase, partial [Desulfobacula sp.]